MISPIHQMNKHNNTDLFQIMDTVSGDLYSKITCISKDINFSLNKGFYDTHRKIWES